MSWGWNTDGSLGLKSDNEDENFENDEHMGVFCDPNLVNIFPINVDIGEISAGARHSAFMTIDKSLWLCGSNKHGQRGSEKSIDLEIDSKIFCLSWFTFILNRSRE